jgi:16S rRNA processing protein RimM
VKPSSPPDAFVVMGRVGAPYGVSGWIKVQTLTEVVDSLLGYPCWWLGHGDDWRKYKLLEGRVHGTGLVARIAGIADRNAAAQIRGQSIALRRVELPPPPDGEYYWADLIGLSVVNLQGENLGQVAEIFSTGASDVVIVRGERERLIPFVAPVLVQVELERERLVVDWGVDY